AESVEPVSGLLGQHCRVGAETHAHELRQRIRLLRRLRAGERDGDSAVRLSQQPLGVVEGVLPGNLLEPAEADAPQGLGDPVLGVEVREAEAALVAEPALVDLGVVAREDSLDLALALVDVDVAADRTQATDAWHRLELPGPDLESRLRWQKRAHRAELGHVAGERAGVRLVLEGG